MTAIASTTATVATAAAAAIGSSSVLKCIHIAGFHGCGFFMRAMGILRSLSILFPNRIQVIEHEFPDRTSYRSWLLAEASDTTTSFRSFFPESSKARNHSSSPFVWFTKIPSVSTTTPENTTTICDPADIEEYLGGHDDTIAWSRSFFTPTTPTTAKVPSQQPIPDGYTKNHGYEYDLIVIGGGSGGMAAAKEAASYGAKVALLDFVKPSPGLATTWGLGGTCVNVGCIPKKLFHIGAQVRESITMDASSFGIQINPNEEDARKDEVPMMLTEPTTKVYWQVVRENIQNYIRSLNFKYRVRLREKNVLYLNQLAKFIDPHTIEATDKKGNVVQMTAARYLIAVGGRPTPLDCIGSELSISSDDIFSLDKPPGKTLCIGASYISLECAGFLSGLFQYDVTVAVRSILLRGFDRECVDYIQQYMEHIPNLKFKHNVVPTKLCKVIDHDKERIHVDFSDGTSDIFDTVLTAVGRTADTHKLGIKELGVEINPKNGKIVGLPCEQSTIPHIYAVGDVLDGTPELTPVAIQAGILLARRLFGTSKELMDYRNVCTTVFTPIEYACVGYSEDDAIATFGTEAIEVYHRNYLPLEWSLTYARQHTNSFTKVIANKLDKKKIIGIHFVGPNAGEVLQGYGVAIKKGISYEELVDTVGIHPTNAEEIVSLTVTKSSGEDAGAGGC